MNPIKVLVFLGLILPAGEALARQATAEEIQQWCAGTSTLNIRVTNTTRERACRHYGFSVGVGSANPRETGNSGVPTATREAPVQPSAPLSEAAPAVDDSGTLTGGTVTHPGACNDDALTAAIPRGRNSAPGFPTSQSAYREYSVSQILAGNIPSHLRNLVPIRMGGANSSCMGHTGPLTLCAMPEPIAVGGTDNYQYTNLRINDAVQVGRELGFILPTSHMVTAIENAATVEVRSLTRPWWCGEGGDCSGGEPHRFQTQSREVRALVQGNGNYRPGVLVAGGYKDYALSHRLSRSGNGYANMSLYGWNGIQSGRDRIQHDSNHLDYSQVPRFMSQWVQVGDRWENMATLLADRNCAAILNGGQTINSNITGAFSNPGLRPPGGGNTPRGGDDSLTSM